MANQAVNSLARISARQTLVSIEVLTMLMASYTYVLCQAVSLLAYLIISMYPWLTSLFLPQVDLRALQRSFVSRLKPMLLDLSTTHLLPYITVVNGTSSTSIMASLVSKKLLPRARKALDETTTMDCEARMAEVFKCLSSELLEFFSNPPIAGEKKNEGLLSTHIG